MGRGPQGSTGHARRVRGAGLLALLGLGTEAVRRLVERPLTDLADALGPGAPDTLPFDRLVTSGCAVGLAASWCWLALVATALTVEAVRRPAGAALRAGAATGGPRLVRVLVLALLGVSAAAAPVTADPGNHATPRTSVPDRGVAGLPLPDRLGSADARPGRPAMSTAVGTVVQVRPGDSLWSIAAGLRTGASPVEIDRTWRALAAANADRLGPDPDLIFPGTVLRVPDLPTLGKDHP